MKKSLSRPLLVSFLTFALLIISGIALLPSGQPETLPPAEEVGRQENITPEEGCELMQTFSYTRCQHTVTRRLPAPVEVLGKSLAEVEGLYDGFRITEFSSAMIKMEKQLQLFCPDHLVLMPDGAGMLCVFENRYGDAMALVNELNIPVRDLPAAAKEEAEMGIGFSTAEEMEMWLESVES